MKRLMLVAVVTLVIGSNTGCCLIDGLFGIRGRHYPICGGRGAQCGPGDCDACGQGGLAGRRGDGYGRNGDGYGSRPDSYYPSQSGTVAYPYYTNRGPRDYFAKNPNSIGPE